MQKHFTLAALLGACLALVGCAQGPGHTRAAGTIGGTVAGAAIGASVARNSGQGAVVGGILGLVAGTVAGESIAQDQERYGNPPFVRHDVPPECAPPCPPPGTVQRVYYHPAPRYRYYRHYHYGPPPPGYYVYYGP